MSERPFAQLLAASARRHSHLCPRQVLGVRIALAGASALRLDVPRTGKDLLVILETDGCFADGIEVTTGCTVGHRTLRIEDYGKIAATLVDLTTEQAVRVSPQLDVRQKAAAYAKAEGRHYFAQLLAYQFMPDAELLTIQSVCLSVPVSAIISRPGARAICEACGEEVINDRWSMVDGRRLCHTCAAGGYYAPFEASAQILTGQSVPAEY